MRFSQRAGKSIALICLVAGLALPLGASAAQAAPLQMSFTEARANVGVQLSDAALFAAPDTAPFTAQIDPATGAITDGTLTVPDFSTHITNPIDADVLVHFNIGQITGSFDSATGALTGTGTAGGTLTANGKQCTVATVPSPLTLSTAGQSGGANPRSGAPFVWGLAWDGAVAGQWTDMTATPVDPGDPSDVSFCNNVEGQIGGPGGIWLNQDVPNPDAPVCSATSAATAFQTPAELTLTCTGTDRVISIAAAPSHGTLGTIDQATGTITYTPDAGYSGTDSFTFKAANPGGTSPEVTAAIEVQGQPGAGPPPTEPPATQERKCRHKKVFKHGRCVKKKAKKHMATTTQGLSSPPRTATR